MSKYNKNKEEFDCRYEIDKRLNEYYEGKPQPMDLKLTVFDLNKFIAVLINRDNINLVDRDFVETIDRVVKIQSDNKLDNNKNGSIQYLINKKYFIIEVIKFINLSHVGYSYDRETFINRIRERFSGMLKFESILDELDSDEFILTQQDVLETRELLSGALEKYNNQYIYEILYKALEKLKNNEYKSHKEATEEMNYIIQKIADFTTKVVDIKSPNNSDLGILITSDMKEEIVQRAMSKLIDISKPLKTSVKEMNRMIDGFYKRKLYLYAGIPNTGKTTTLAQFAVDCRRYNKAEDVLCNPEKQAIVVYFTMEDSSEDIVNRSIGLSGIEQLRPENSTLEDMTKKFFEAHKNVESDIGLLIKEYGGNTATVADMEAFLSRVEEHYNAEIVAVFVDYIKRVKCTTSRSSEEYAVLCEVSNLLRNMAFKFNCPVISAAQLNREAQKIIEENINRGTADTAKNVGSSNIGSSFDLVANTDALVLINSEYGHKSNRKYMAFKRLKMRYRPKADTTYFVVPMTPMGGFVKDIDIADITDNERDYNYRRQFRSYTSISEAEREYCNAHGIDYDIGAKDSQCGERTISSCSSTLPGNETETRTIQFPINTIR